MIIEKTTDAAGLQFDSVKNMYNPQYKNLTSKRYICKQDSAGITKCHKNTWWKQFYCHSGLKLKRCPYAGFIKIENEHHAFHEVIETIPAPQRPVKYIKRATLLSQQQ